MEMGVPNPNPLISCIVRDHSLEFQLCNRSKSFKVVVIHFLMYACTGKGKEYERNIETDRLPRKRLSYASRASLYTFYPVER